MRSSMPLEDRMAETVRGSLAMQRLVSVEEVPKKEMNPASSNTGKPKGQSLLHEGGRDEGVPVPANAQPR